MKTRIDQPKAIMVFLSIALVSFLGCSKNENGPKHPVEVQFQLLNAAGEPTTSFREGEDIIFDYKIVNKSAQEVVWFRNTAEYQTIFELSQITSNQGTKVLGTPHQNLKIYAIGLELGGTKVTPNAEVALRMTWMGDWDRTIFFNTVLDGMYDLLGEKSLQSSFFEYLYQPSLPKGKYSVALDQTLEFEDFDDLIVDKTIAFEVL